MYLRRRSFLFLSLAGGACVLLSDRLWAQTAPDRSHQPVIDLPLLAEDGSAVPIQVSVDHPMDPDHYIKQIEVVLDTDPVPAKGIYRFTPDNGRASVAFQMRSGVGGTLKAIVECSRHGKVVGTKEVRVVEGGCTTAPDKVAKGRLGGHPMLRVGRIARPGEIVEVRAKVNHNSYTGLVLQGGKIVRERPEFFVKQMRVYLDQQLVSDFQLTSAVSPNPLFRFPLKVNRPGLLRVVFVNNEGQQWEISEPLRVAG